MTKKDLKPRHIISLLFSGYIILLQFRSEAIYLTKKPDSKVITNNHGCFLFVKLSGCVF